jgi:hydroxyacid-oxoacid transhydrogenase
MTCAHAVSEGFESAFAIDASRIVFGAGALDELGEHVASLGCRRVALFTDARVARLEHVARARKSLQNANIDCVVYDAVHVEPTDASFLDAARFATGGRFDGYVSVGGGSSIDTCKAAALYATHPADFLDYVNAPVGAGRPVPGPLPPHVACPTTCGTGSETTGIAVCDVLALRAKTGIASPRIRPALALVDPSCTHTLPREVVASSGFDVLCHALESYTARPYTARERKRPRPMSQGANPWSDLGSLEALRLCAENLVAAVGGDDAARDALAWAATLAGVAFGNAGVHVPHAMAYAVAGLVRDFRMPGYPKEEPMVPHGISVVVNAPSAFRFTASARPERHARAAACLGERAAPDEAGDALAAALERLMRSAGVPVGLRAVGYAEGDVPALTQGTIVQKRLLSNAPRDVGEADLAALFSEAMR